MATKKTKLARAAGESDATFAWRQQHAERAFAESAGAAPPQFSSSKKLAAPRVGHVACRACGAPVSTDASGKLIFGGDVPAGAMTCAHCNAPVKYHGGDDGDGDEATMDEMTSDSDALEELIEADEEDASAAPMRELREMPSRDPKTGAPMSVLDDPRFQRRFREELRRRLRPAR